MILLTWVLLATVYVLCGAITILFLGNYVKYNEEGIVLLLWPLFLAVWLFISIKYGLKLIKVFMARVLNDTE